MNVLSLFSGAGGLDLGLERAGMTIVGHCELDPTARQVLARHWPDVPCHPDVTTLDGRDWYGRVDVVAGGSPCTDLSMAGRRAGLAGEHSGLFWHQCRIATESAARWVVWENVYGALSSNDGRDFAAVLWGLTGFMPAVPADGWRTVGVCVGVDRTAVWRVLDAQWFGVAQRRRRVFVVAGPAGECGPEVLVEPESVPRGARPSRTAGQEVAGTLGGGSPGRGWSDDTDRMTFIPVDLAQVTSGANRSNPQPGDPAPTLAAGGRLAVAAYPLAMRGRPGGAELELGEPDIYNALRAGDGGSSRQNGVLTPDLAVRRLTPRECERLMGWPDDWSKWAADGRVIADSHRYRMCGNGVVAPLAEWIGRRMVTVAGVS